MIQDFPREQLTRQKQQAMLVSSYKLAVAHLYSPQTRKQGKQILLSILNNPDSLEPALKQLRLSVFLSLAEVSKAQNQIKYALYYWHEATKIQTSFNIWIKMAQLLQQLRSQYLAQSHNHQKSAARIGLYEIQQQIQYAYKNAIKQSPGIWREQLVIKLSNAYRQHGKELQFRDLQQIIKMQNYQQAYIDRSIQVKKDQPENQVIVQRTSLLDKIKLPVCFVMVDITGKQQVPVWDYLLTCSNLLLSQFINTKKSKKHEQILTKISKFNSFKSKVDLQIKKWTPQIQSEQNNQDNLQQVNGQLNNKQNVIFDQQQQDFLQKLNSLIIDSYKDITKDKQSLGIIQKSKKNQQVSISSTYPANSNSKVIFQSVADYYKQTLSNKNIQLSLFESLKYIDPVLNQQIKIPQNIQTQSPYSLTFEPLIQNIKKASIQKQNGTMSNEQQISGPRQRRPNLLTQLQSTPVSNRKQNGIEDQKSLYQANILSKSKQKFTKWIESVSTQKFSNALQYSQSLICKIFQIYNEFNLIPCLDFENSSNLQFLSLKNTNKLLAASLIKLSQDYQTTILQFDDDYCDKNRQNIIPFNLLAKYIDEQIAINNTKLLKVHQNILDTIRQKIHRVIYSKTLHKNKTGNVQYTIQQLLLILELLHLCLFLCSTPLAINQSKLKHYEKYYTTFYTLYQQINVGHLNDELVLNPLSKNINSFTPLAPALLSQKLAVRLNKSKLKQLSQQQNENQNQQANLIASVDRLLLKNYNQNSKQGNKIYQIVESVKSIISLNIGSLALYLKSFNKMVALLFSHLDSSTTGFNGKLITSTLKLMQLPMLIQALHTKLTEDKKSQKQQKNPKQQNADIQQNAVANEIKVQTEPYHIKLLKQYNEKVLTLFNLIKIYLISELDQVHSSLCLRIVFYLFEDALKTMNQLYQIQNKQKHIQIIDNQVENGDCIIIDDSDQQLQNQHKSKIFSNLHYIHVEQLCHLIVLLNSLIKLRESSQIRKKFYHRILIKNIRFLYDNYQVSRNPSPLRVQIYRIYSDTFHSKYFKPKKMEDCLGYFLMISREFSNEFDKKEVEFELKMKRVFNQCFIIFKNDYESEQQYAYCDRFIRAMELFVSLMRKKTKQCDEIIRFFTGKQVICECCQALYLKNNLQKQPFAKEVLLVVAKFLQNRKNSEKNSISNELQNKQALDNKANEIKQVKKQGNNCIQLDEQVEKYYLKYFLLGINTSKAWHQMLRFQVSKVYQYFDALTGSQFVQFTETKQVAKQKQQPTDGAVEQYKHKFKYAKAIASFIVKHFNSEQFADTKNYALYRINLTNTLKISERKWNKSLSQLTGIPAIRRMHNSKYMQGIITVILRKTESNMSNEDQQFANGNQYPEIAYLFYTEFKLPFMVYQCENSHELKNDLKILQSTLSQGIQLLKDLEISKQNEIHLKTDNNNLMVDENQNAQHCKSLLSSKYSIKHIDKELKVQIISNLCRVILDCLSHIKKTLFTLKQQTQATSVTQKKQKFIRTKQQLKPSQLDQKCISKLETLVQINRVIKLYQVQLQSWKYQQVESVNVVRDQTISSQQKSVSKKLIQFKDKYSFLDYTATFNEIELSLQLFLKLLDQISKADISTRLKKQNYCRYIFLSNLWCSKIYNFFNSNQKCQLYIKQIANMKNQDLVSFYHHYQNEPTQQNQILAQFYSRDLVFHCLKLEAVQHILEVYSGKESGSTDHWETCLMLIRKLMKMCTVKVQNQKDKEKKGKQSKQADIKIKQDASKTMVDESIKQSSKPAEQQEDKDKAKQKDKPKKGKKQDKSKADKDKDKQKSQKSQKRIKWLYILFMKGVQLYFQAVVNVVNTKNEPLQQKFEKALLQFKNKIKRDGEKQKKGKEQDKQKQKEKEKEKQKDKKSTAQNGVGQKIYGAKIVSQLQSFISFYEQKFNKKIRMKAPKKQKGEIEEANKTNQPNNQTQNQTQVQKVQNNHSDTLNREYQDKAEKLETIKIKQQEQLEVLSDQDDDQNAYAVNGSEYRTENQGRMKIEEVLGEEEEEQHQFIDNHINFKKEEQWPYVEYKILYQEQDYDEGDDSDNP